ncbi:MAG: diguanylate cyclase domain-containing protein [Romboutsia sp.]|uniref:diguanylate cyclase domain-containing protein n=1 Tax=Romboutsia sp. TaxID=1965302 RepID=UPI003F320CDC
MKFNLENIIYEAEIRTTSLVENNYLEYIISEKSEYISDILNQGDSLELAQIYYLIALERGIKCKIEESIEYLKKGIIIAKRIKNNLWIGKYYSKLSEIKIKEGNNLLSRRYFIKAIKLLKNENNIQQLAIAYTRRLLGLRWSNSNKKYIHLYLEKIENIMELWEDKEHGYYYILMGTTYAYFLQEPISAMRYFVEGMKIGEKYKITEINGLILYYLGSIYLDYMHNPLEAIRNLEPLIYNMKYDVMNRELKCSYIVELIEAYIEASKLLQAKYCIEYSKSYIKDIEDSIHESTKIMLIYLEAKLGSCESENNNLDKSLELALGALEDYMKNKINFKYTHFDCNINIVIGDLYFRLNQYEKSIQYYEESVKESKKWGKYYEKRAYYRLAKVYEEKEHYEKALENYKICEAIFKDILKEHSFIKYENMHKEFEKTYKEEEIRNLNTYNNIIKEESYKDHLTKVFNRSYLNDYIKDKVNITNVYALMVDIDYFKNYNDNYGHLKGDSILISVAQCINDSCNSCSDKVIRYGGEEFLILSYSKDEKYLEKLPHIIINNIIELNIEHKYSKVSHVVTVSIGVSKLDIYSSLDYNELINQADKALYIAKEEGRNKIIKNLTSQYEK